MTQTAPDRPELRLSLRLDFSPGGRLGPGKVALLEGIGRSGSIAGAARAMGMSYRRAWLLVDALNHMFRQPLVETQPGGSKGGGARLTALGDEVVAHYRTIEATALAANAGPIAGLKAALGDGPAADEA